MDVRYPEGPLPNIRKAELSDVPALLEMINRYAAEGIMLRRTLTELFEAVREFLIAEGDPAARHRSSRLGQCEWRPG